jgi:hypothetical protein
MCSDIENGKRYVLDDDTRKIRILHKKIIFGTGNYKLVEVILNDFKSQSKSNGSLETLQAISRYRAKEFENALGQELLKQRYTTPYGIQYLGFTVAEWDNGKPRISWILNNVNNFEITSAVPQPGYAKVLASGCKIEEVQEHINKAFYEYKDISKFFVDTYNKFTDEQIGGTLRIYKLENGEIMLFNKQPILDNKEILRR